MKRIKLKLYRVLREIGFQRFEIHQLAKSNHRINLQDYEEAYYLNLLEDSFQLHISEEDIQQLKTINSTVTYLNKRL